MSPASASGSECLGDLGTTPGRYQHESVRFRLIRMHRALDQQDAKERSLSGTGLGLSAHIATGEAIGNGGLHRKRFGDAAMP